MKNLFLKLFILLLFSIQVKGQVGSIVFSYDKKGQVKEKQVILLPVLTINNSSTIDNDTLNLENLVISTNVSLGPNPSTNSTIIRIKENIPPNIIVTYVIYTSNGLVMDTNDFLGNQYKLDISKLSPGVYYLVIKYNSKSEWQTLVKK